MPAELDKERLELERKKHEDETRLAEERLRLDRRASGRLSGGAVTLFGHLGRSNVAFFGHTQVTDAGIR
jgi:hypothetical protein